MLKQYKSIIFIIAVLLSFSSCISTKKLTYLQEDSEAVDSIISLQRLDKPYRIQTGDLLSIRVKALDQELVGMFNPVGEENTNATGE